MKTPNLQHTKVFVSDNGRRELCNETIEPDDLESRIAYLSEHHAGNPVDTKFHRVFFFGIKLI